MVEIGQFIKPMNCLQSAPDKSVQFFFLISQQKHMLWVLKRTVSFKTYVVGTQKNHLNETVLLSTHNICLY